MSQEDQNREWKESWRDEYLRWLCGFANAQGGALIIGRRDDGTAVGVPQSAKLLQELPNKIRDLLGIVAEVNLVKGAALDRFLLQRQGRTWDGVPVHQVSETDLDAHALAAFGEKAARSGRVEESVLSETVTQTLDNLNFTENGVLRRAALLLFHPQPTRFFTGTSVKIGYFRNDADLLFQDEVTGPLGEQVDKALDLLTTKYLKAAISYEGLQRRDVLPYPREALREALLNAVVHKDYASGVPIQISVYENKLIFWNEGRLPENWTVANLLAKHPSRPYNPLIAAAFFRMGMIESWGRGYEKIRQACRTHGNAEPMLRYDLGGLWVEFLPLPPETPPETPLKTPEAALELLSRSPQPTLAEIAVILGKDESTIKRAVKKLQDEGRIEHVGPNKRGHWIIKKGNHND